MKIPSLLLCIMICCFACQGEKPQKHAVLKEQSMLTVTDSIPNTLLYEHHGFRFVFSDLTDPYEMGLYQKLQIQRKDSTLITISADILELEGKSFQLDKEHVFETATATYYLITANNRPEPNYYYVVQCTDANAKLIGKTTPNSKQQFGDLDGDGLLEIAGFTTHCQATDEEDFNDPEFCLEYFEVLEVGETIQRDLATEKVFLKKLRNGKKLPFK